jgi:hypothetical protein
MIGRHCFRRGVKSKERVLRLSENETRADFFAVHVGPGPLVTGALMGTTCLRK